jgi:ComF family protein
VALKSGWFEALLGLRCPGCGKSLDQATLCKACEAELVPRHVPNFVYLGSYQRFGNLGRAIKYRGHRDLAALAGRKLALGVRQADWPVGGVCAVPTLFFRQIQRGYNQAELIAQAAAKELGMPYRAVLARAAYSKSQTQKTLSERMELPEDTFVVKARVSGVWLLVDDVVTTGTTFARARSSLLDAGAAKVFGAAIAVKSPHEISWFSL